MLKSEQLRIFTSIVQQGTLTKAAQQLGFSKAHVSEQVAELETRLGVRLLRRTTRRLSLTEEGEIFLREALTIIRQMDDLELIFATRRNQLTGLLTVTAPIDLATEVLAPGLVSFQKRHPGIQVKLIVTDSVLDHVRDKVDLAIRVSKLETSELIQRKVGEARLGLMATPDFLNRLDPSPARPSDLKDYKVYFHRPLSDVQMFSGNESDRLSLANDVAINSIAAVKAFCLAQGGLGLLPLFACRHERTSGTLRHLLPSWTIKPPVFYFLYEKGALSNPRLQAFIDFFQPLVAKAVAGLDDQDGVLVSVPRPQ